MNKAIKAKWIRALRSGKYRQARMALRCVRRDGPTYCCLGVLCNVIDPKGWEKDIGGVWHGCAGELYLKDRDPIGLSADHQRKLVKLNDNDRATFGVIARWIEENL